MADAHILRQPKPSVLDRVVRLKDLPVIRDLIAAAQEWQKDDGPMLAASVAYYGALSFFPLMLILLAIFGYVLKYSARVQDAQYELLELLSDNVSPQIAEAVGALLQNIKASAAVGGPAGLLTLLFAAIGIFGRFDAAFDRIWNIPAKKGQGILAMMKSALVDRARAFLLLLGVGALLVTMFFAGVIITIVRAQTGVLSRVSALWDLVELGTSVGTAAFAFTVMYKFLPKIRVRWADALRGALVASVAWELGRQLFQSYVVGSKYSVYGVVGSFIALMLWIYFGSSVVFYGAEFSQVMARKREPPETD